jgi:hypothetical protein
MNPSNFFKTICIALTLIPLSTLAVPATDLGRFVDNGIATLDTATGLEWLDIPFTAGMSYLSVEEECQPGGDFDSYRHANRNEIWDIFTAFGFTDDAVQLNDSVRLFIDLFGNSPTSEWTDNVLGHADITGEDEGLTPLFGVSASKVSDQVFIENGWTWHNPSREYENIGSFLVRQRGEPHPVPELDATPAPLALGLLLLTALLRRERRKS